MVNIFQGVQNHGLDEDNELLHHIYLDVYRGEVVGFSHFYMDIKNDGKKIVEEVILGKKNKIKKVAVDEKAL